jgi:hypothetical protein
MLEHLPPIHVLCAPSRRRCLIQRWSCLFIPRRWKQDTMNRSGTGRKQPYYSEKLGHSKCPWRVSVHDVSMLGAKLNYPATGTDSSHFTTFSDCEHQHCITAHLTTLASLPWNTQSHFRCDGDSQITPLRWELTHGSALTCRTRCMKQIGLHNQAGLVI